ncbi:MAG: hypothetical protein OXH63_04655, partial [Gemmatimonadetes bacterium]|nr:hypothetical protein [Gemmatimonadota bacterium]
KFLTLHLGKEAVVSGKAPIHAHDAFNRNQALERANRALPDCWRGLLNEPHQVLYDLLRERVKARCGVEPREDDVNRFLTKAATGANWQIHGHREEPLPDSPIPSTPHAAFSKSRQGGKTPDGDFRHPILQVLIEMDGSATRRQVLHELTKVMASRLGDYDRETHKDGSVRWEKAAEFEASKMRREGLLKPVKQKGLWEISDQGRSYWGERR